MKGEWAWLEHGQVFIPENKVTPSPEYRYEALRGYMGHLAAFRGTVCIGYIDTRSLGFETAKDWLKSQGGK